MDGPGRRRSRQPRSQSHACARGVAHADARTRADGDADTVGSAHQGAYGDAASHLDTRSDLHALGHGYAQADGHTRRHGRGGDRVDAPCHGHAEAQTAYRHLHARADGHARRHGRGGDRVDTSCDSHANASIGSRDRYGDPPPRATATKVPPPVYEPPATHTPVPPPDTPTPTREPKPPPPDTHTPTPQAVDTATPAPAPAPATYPSPTFTRFEVLSETDIRVRWTDHPGAFLYKLESRQTALHNWVSQGFTPRTVMRVGGLSGCTRYEFRLKALGVASDGVSKWSNWTAIRDATTTCPPTPTPVPSPTPVTYAEFVDPPGRATMCATGRTKRTRTGTATYHAADGSVHTATAEVFSAVIQPWHMRERETRCVQARFTTKSTPGAAGLTWSGDLYVTEAVIELDDVATLNGMTLVNFFGLFDPVTPDRSSTADSSATPYTCASPCRGATTQADMVEVGPRYAKVPTYYVYGRTRSPWRAGSSTRFTRLPSGGCSPSWAAARGALRRDCQRSAGGPATAS